MLILFLGVQSFGAMHTLPKALRERLEAKYELDEGRVAADSLSNDGTRKILVSFGGQEVECMTSSLDLCH